MTKIVLAMLCLLASMQAKASSFSTDYTDLWFNANESGWGVNIIQQDNTLFATLFIYSSSGAAAWYVASNATFTGLQGNSLVFSGPLYQTSGPFFGGGFNPSAVNVRQVGTLTARFDTIVAGVLAYSVDGVSVTKNITRQTWKNNSIAGVYIGATIGTYTGCPSSGYAEEPAIFTVTQSGSSVGIVALGNNGASCTYSGTYQQAGRMGVIDGTLSCSSGARGTFAAFELEAGISGLTGRAVTALGGTCGWSGRLGGLRRGS